LAKRSPGNRSLQPRHAGFGKPNHAAAQIRFDSGEFDQAEGDDRGAGVSRRVQVCVPIQSRICCHAMVPTLVETGAPFLNSINVGTCRTAYLFGTSGS
jgi:hypothetical protein